MEKLIFKSSNAILKYVEDDDITSIDYEVEENADGDFIGGNFLFEKDEALKAYGFSDVEELIPYCKRLVLNIEDVEMKWHTIMADFELHNIDVSPDEYEGGSDFMTNI